MRVLKKEVTWYTWSLLLLWLAFDGLEALRPTRTLTSRSVRLAAAAVAVQKGGPGLTISLDSLAAAPKTAQWLAIDMPRVIPPGKPTDDWLLWFQARDTGMDPSVVKLSTGRVLFATSKDGLSGWTMHEDSPIMGPHKETGDWFYFDSEHLGLGDVIKPGGAAQSKFATQDGVFLMYIFGGRNDPVTLPDNTVVKGLRMEIGVAVSQDGAHWSRVEGPNPYGSVLEPGKSLGDFDGQFVGWPSVIETDGEYRMYYHTYNALTRKYCVCLAVARDGLMNWKKRGIVFCPDSGPDAFDSMGATRRHIVKLANGGYKMWYEGVSSSGQVAIGCASSPDGFAWTKVSDQPVFEASSNADAWDGGGVGSPHLIWLEDVRRWRMYYAGWGRDEGGDSAGAGGLQISRSSIGVAESLDDSGLGFRRIVTAADN